jgi:hypothetical protein
MLLSHLISLFLVLYCVGLAAADPIGTFDLL